MQTLETVSVNASASTGDPVWPTTPSGNWMAPWSGHIGSAQNAWYMDYVETKIANSTAAKLAWEAGGKPITIAVLTMFGGAVAADVLYLREGVGVGSALTADESVDIASGGKWTKDVIERRAPGADAATSRHVVEKIDGRTNSVTHQVTKDGEVIHQHQTHIGKSGTERQFPDAWVEYPNVPGEGQ
jgi:hypothetical protein